ncbi:deoxyribose-phosphate aldolase [Enterococcus sp. AZ103]|uniref:deoxyribose-phosphate aldolase n=1 Tax=Enterococcus sp. AZ103 TaxID=2774628 RepID=UPI003F2991BA
MKPTKKAQDMTSIELARYIDQSVLKPEFTIEETKKYIQEGIDFKCKTVCVNPWAVPLAAEMCAGTETKVCPVCDFPFGQSSTASKVAQAEIILKDYAKDIAELDIVANYGWLRSGRYEEVTQDLKAVADICHQYGVAVKVILETDALTVEQVRKGCDCVVAAGGDFVKTSTGFLTGHEGNGATVEIIQIMMDQVAGKAKIKGSGAIRTREHFLQLIDMGIDRMGIGYRSTPTVLGLDK